MTRPHLLMIREPGMDRPKCSGHPAMPAEWSCVEFYRGTIVLYEVRPAPGVVLHVMRENARPDGSEALYAIFGDQSHLDTLRAMLDDSVPAATMREVWDAATSGNDTARMVLRAWRDWRIDGTVRVGTDDLGDLITKSVTDKPWRLNHGPEGSVLPDPAVTPLPWLLGFDGAIVTDTADAYAQVTALHRPALRHTVAGRGDPQSFDAEAA